MSGEPSNELSQEQIEQYVLDRLSDGDLLSAIAEELGVKRTTLYSRFLTDDAKIDAYTRARAEGLMARGERLRDRAKAVLPLLASGGIDPAAVSQLKLEIETEKWTLAKLHASVFGDKVQTEVTGAGGKDLVPALQPADVARELAFILAKAAAEKDKDGT